jgi:hypothetical protein
MYIVTESTSAIVKLVMDELPNIRGKLVQEAEGCLPALGLQPDNTLSVEDDTAHIVEHSEAMLNERNMHTYLHGWDAACMKMLVFSSNVYWNLHETFWFGRNSPFLNDPAARARISTPSWVMYELTGAAVSLFVKHFSGTDSNLHDTSYIVLSAVLRQAGYPRRKTSCNFRLKSFNLSQLESAPR